MQPKTEMKMDKASFERLKKTVQNMAESNRLSQLDPNYAVKIPKEVGIQLTNRCNLRCKHCFEWNQEGFNHDLTKKQLDHELDFDIVEKIFKQTCETKANLFLWGGEPMYYREWDRLTRLLEQDPRWSVLCTNGIMVEDKMDSLLRISENLAILTSIEGFEAENDAIRGTGSYKKVMAGMDKVLSLQKKGIFKGKQSVHCTISDAMIGKLYDFMVYFEDLGVDTVYFCFPWYLPKEVSLAMDQFFEEKFSWLVGENSQQKKSWHSFKFRINPDLVTYLEEEMRRINERTWKIRIRYQPALEISQVKDYILGTTATAQHKKKCLAITNRMDVLADGSVSACKLFSEFDVGNLKTMDVEEVWNGEKFRKVRAILSSGLMPVCSKCILLYLNGI